MTHIDESEMVANQCDLCLKSFKNQKTLTFHVKYVHQNMWHYQSKPVHCKMCNKTFCGNNILKRHFDQVHLGHRNYICEKCGQSFQNSRNLVKHFKKVHLDIEDKSKCDFCKKLISNRYMKDHKNAIHLNIRKFKCTCCDKYFNLMSVMKMHVKRVHLRKNFSRDNDKNILEKPKAYQICQKHKCDVCGKNFASNSKLQRHINGLHKKNKNFHCNWCEMKYDWKQSLDNHVRIVHGNKKVKFVNKVYQKQDRIQKEGIKIMVENTDVENIDHKHKSTSATKNELSSKNECLQCMVCNVILKTHVDFFEHVEKKHEIES